MEKMVSKLNQFYKDKTVLVTGHTGFKGSWLSVILNLLGANVVGYSLNPPTNPNLFEIANLKSIVKSNIGDIRNIDNLKKVMDEHKPSIVFHLAAQPLVIDSYAAPLYTYETNVIGTLNLLDIIRTTDYVKSLVNITTDKVYKNNEWIWGYREEEELDGFDPYSNSKSCSELITKTYKRALIGDKVAISTVRAGNVIGGGDFSTNRILPDCMRALLTSSDISIRNPNSIRPYQHVIEPLIAYLMIGYYQFLDTRFADSYNVGPVEQDCISTGNLVDLFCKYSYKPINYKAINISGPHEANFLKLDISKISSIIGFKPKWNIQKAVKKTIDWIECYEHNPDKIREIMYNQINEYLTEE